MPLHNHRGQLLDFTKAEPKTIHKVVVYTPSRNVSSKHFLKKGRESSKSGFVHYFSENDCHAICITLLTPAEISQYFGFRAEYVFRDSNANLVSEKALMGKYLTDSGPIADIRNEHELVADCHVNDPETFSVSQLLYSYLEQLQAYAGPTGSLRYHQILSILAMMKRNVMHELKKRLRWAMDRASNKEPCLPTRMYLFYMKCSFLFVSLEQVDPEVRVSFLERYAFV